VKSARNAITNLALFAFALATAAAAQQPFIVADDLPPKCHHGPTPECEVIVLTNMRRSTQELSGAMEKLLQSPSFSRSVAKSSHERYVTLQDFLDTALSAEASPNSFSALHLFLLLDLYKDAREEADAFINLVNLKPNPSREEQDAALELNRYLASSSPVAGELSPFVIAEILKLQDSCSHKMN
jgi:hypothetical protein